MALSLVGGGALLVAPWPTLALAAAVAPLVRRPGLAALALLAMLTGWARSHAAVARYEEARTSALHALPRVARCSGEATVASSPVRTHGVLRWNAAATLDCDPGAPPWSGLVTLYGGPHDLARGDRVEVVVQIAPPERLWNPETGDVRPRETRRGVLRTGSAIDVRYVRRGASVAWLIDRARAHTRARIDATFPADTAPMARALVLGETDLAASDDAAFRMSGLAHLLAVSGMHLVLVVLGVLHALRAFLVRVEWLAARLDVGRLSALVGIPFAWLYADFAGGSGSAVRAAWMLTAALAAQAIGRKGTAPRSFGLSLLGAALFDPLVLFDVSFVLSACATAGLIVFSTPIGEALARRAPRWMGGVMRAMGTTLAATIPCAPVLALFSPTLPAGGALANLLAVPVGDAAALPVCLLHGVLSPWPAAERGSALVASGALWLVRAVARVSAHTSWLQVGVPPPSAWQMAALCFGFAAVVIGGRRRVALVALALAATLLLELPVRAAGAPRGVLRATFLDVGQGDGALVDLPDGEAMMIDGGGLVGSPIDVGTRVVAPVLRARRRDRLALVVLSHPHPDHFGGLATGLGAVRSGALWDTGQGEREGVGGGYAALLEHMRAARVPVLRPAALCGQHLLGGARVEVLAPCPGPTPERGPNDNSFVLRISYGRRAFLFVGDAEHEEEADLLRHPDRLRADVLKVGHHGSRTSSSPAFVRAVAPELAVISCGIRNRFGHPNPVTLTTLRAENIPVLRTDVVGQVVVGTDGDGLFVGDAVAR